MTRKEIAESYLRLVARDGDRRHSGMYVRLGYEYGVPVGRIIMLTQLPSDIVMAHIEGGL